jgi:hypothetical protein
LQTKPPPEEKLQGAAYGSWIEADSEFNRSIKRALLKGNWGNSHRNVHAAIILAKYSKENPGIVRLGDDNRRARAECSFQRYEARIAPWRLRNGTGAEAPHAKAASENMKQDIVRNDDEGLTLLNLLTAFEICIERIDDCADDVMAVLFSAMAVAPK